MSSAAKLSEARVLSCQLPPAWSASFLVLVKGVAELAMEQSKRGGGKTDVREAFTKLLKCNVEEKHGGVWQCFVGKKFAFNVRSHTASNYSQQMIICEVPIGGSSQHLLAYRSPPAELAGSPAEPEPEPEAASLPAAAGIVQVVDTDMPTKQRDQMLQMLTDVITEMRGGAKPEDAKVDDSKLGQILRERIMKDLKWSPTWHVITGAEKLSGWDSAVTAEKGTRFSAISRPIKVEIFKHNDSSVLPPVGHMSNWFSCNAALMQAMAYLMFMGFAALFIWVSISFDESDTVSLEPVAGWLNLAATELPQPTARYYAQVGTGCFLLTAALCKIPSKLAAQGAARRVAKQPQKNKRA